MVVLMDKLLQNQGEVQQIYTEVRNSIISAQTKTYAAVNSAMVQAYWEIGALIYKACGESERAEYGKGLLKYIADNLTKEFGRGFDERNLRKMRQFYRAYPIRDSLRPELSWTHYRRLLDKNYICLPKQN